MRLHLILAIVTAVLLVITLPRTKNHFGYRDVVALAQQRAAAPYLALPNALTPQLKALSPQQENEIFWKDAFRLWRKNGLPFQVDFYHVSKAFPGGPRVNTVDRKGAHPLAYSPGFFHFGDLVFNPPLPKSLPFAGFYLRFPLPTATETKPNVLNGFFSALGGNYFRALARDQVYGLSARALAIDTAVNGKPEEFPQFTDWWLYQPAADATQLVLDAVVDSPSVTGAYEFKIHPGATTSIDIQASLFFRRSVSRLGIAPFSSMYLYGENAKNHFGDNHPEIHDSDGLLVHSNKDGWLWRPLQQQPFLQIYDFADQNPLGFGLMQRDRDFQHYQDLDARYNVRPSVWVTPHGDWGKGALQQTQLATNNTNTDNVVLFWRPDQVPKAGERLDLNYTVDFFMNDGGRPPLASCRATYVNDPAPPPLPSVALAASLPPGFVGPPLSSVKAAALKLAHAAPPNKKAPPPATTPVQFLVDFAGNGIENFPSGQAPDLEVTAEPQGTLVSDSKVEKNGYDNSWRATFTLTPLKKHVPTELKCRLFPHDTVRKIQLELDAAQTQLTTAQAMNNAPTMENLTHNVIPSELKALHDARGHALTETWTYTWHQ